MPRVQVSCPQCRQPITAEMEQLFDVGNDPQAKQRFLSGNVNTANCPNCGYRGPLSTPIVYHDPEKELLLTFFPPELGLPLNEQERLIGPMITGSKPVPDDHPAPSLTSPARAAIVLAAVAAFVVWLVKFYPR